VNRETYALRWLTVTGEITGVEVTPQREERWTKTQAVDMARVILGKIPADIERELALRSFTVERIA
jgi:hypothetical protein